MKRMIVRAGGAMAAALMVSSCVAPTPASRISGNPVMFDRLSPHHQQMVSEGRLERGMSPQAVWLAWGEPSVRIEGFEKGKATLRWEYAGSRPVYTTSVYGSYGWGGPRRYPYRYGYSAIGVAPEVAYVPTCRATATFVDNKLDSWTSTR